MQQYDPKMDSEKIGSMSHLEDAKSSSLHHVEDNHNPNNGQHGFTADQTTVKEGYFYSPFFLGTMAATGLGLASAVGGFGLAAPNLTLINADIGPDPNITWVSLVYTLTLAIGLLLVGRLSDLFGRRVRYYRN